MAHLAELRAGVIWQFWTALGPELLVPLKISCFRLLAVSQKITPENPQSQRVPGYKNCICHQMTAKNKHQHRMNTPRCFRIVRAAARPFHVGPPVQEPATKPLSASSSGQR
jgi:hypothetical protein